jgi:hypothetical protein
MKTWKDITLRQAQELITIKPSDFTEDLAYEVEVLSILLDKDPVEIESTWSAKQVIETLAEWNFINELPKQQAKLITTFKKDGVRYGLCKFDELSLGQMVDIEEYVNMGLLENIHNIMATLYLPVNGYNIFTKKYTLKPYDSDPDRSEMFLDMDMDFVYGNLLFFYRIVLIYTKNMRDSLVEMSQEMMMKMKTDLEEQIV